MAFESKYSAENNWGEITECGGGLDGTKFSNRPQEFCKPITCLDTTTCESTLDVTQKTTLNETEVVPPQITIGGHVFVPKTGGEIIDGGEIAADGSFPTFPMNRLYLVSG